MVEKAREEEEFPGLGPDLRLKPPDPVGFCLRLEVADGLGHAYGPEGQAHQAADRRQALGASLVQPDDCGAQGPAVLIDADHRCPLSRHRHTGDRLGADR